MKRGLVGILFLALWVAACGGAPSPAFSTSPVPQEVADLSVVFVPSPPSQPVTHAVNARVQSALVAAGFKVLLDASAPHEAEARLSVSATPEQSLFQVTVNGKERTHLRVRAALTIAGDGRAVDELVSEFVSTNDEVTDSDITGIVTGLRESSRLRQFAQAQAQRRTHRVALEERGRELALKEQDRQQDELAWVRSNAVACRVPSSLDACNAVRLYLVQHPRGAHVDEAKAALVEGEPQIERLVRDERTWKSAGVEECRTHAVEKACDGVELYFTKFPAGLHAEEARRLVANEPDERAWKAAGVEECRAHAGEKACDGVQLYVTKFPAGLHADEARRLVARP